MTDKEQTAFALTPPAKFQKVKRIRRPTRLDFLDRVLKEILVQLGWHKGKALIRARDLGLLSQLGGYLVFFRTAVTEKGKEY